MRSIQFSPKLIIQWTDTFFFLIGQHLPELKLNRTLLAAEQSVKEFKRTDNLNDNISWSGFETEWTKQKYFSNLINKFTNEKSSKWLKRKWNLKMCVSTFVFLVFVFAE